MGFLDSRWDTPRAALWMTGTLLSFAVMAIAGRELSHELNTFQVLFWRSMSGAVIVFALLCVYGWQLAKTKYISRQVARNLFHFGAQYGWFYAIALIPLAKVFAIEFTAPVWVALLAAMFLGERLNKAKWIAIVLGFAGVLVITRPGLSAIHHGDLAVLGAAVGYAMVYVITKSLASDESPLTILFYMVVIQTPLAFGLSIADWAWPTGISWMWVVLVGGSALTGHYCMTRSFRLAEASVVVPIDFARLPLIAVVGYFAYQEELELWVVIGAALILFGNFINIRQAARRG